MTITTTTLLENDEMTVFEDTDTNGASVKRTVLKPGHPMFRWQQLHNAATAAVDANRAYLALASPTSAQTAAQVKALTRQIDALIKHALGDGAP